MAFDSQTFDPREPQPTLLRAGVTYTAAPADSPAGGPGPGSFNSLLPHGRAAGSMFHHTTLVADPAAQDWSERLRAYTPDVLDGVLCVQEARDRSLLYLPDAIAEETGRRLEEILKGILPGLLLAIVGVAATTILGAGIGALIGAFAGGVGAIPGAAAGAAAGAKVGLWLLTWLGLAMLVDYVAENIGQAGDLVLEGVRLAWDVRGKPRHVRAAGVDAGARKMAQGVGVFFRLLLEAVVMYLLAKGAGGVAQRLPQLVAQLRRSRLGAGFARWIEHNANSLIRDPRLNRDLRPKPQAGQGGAGSGGGSAQQPRPRQTQSERPPAAPAVRNGGAYKNVPARGGEVHHMPADSISPLSRGDGPGIRMETADHRRTASWGRSKAAQAYRAEQKRLIDQGRFREAIDMDVRDIRSKFGDKYDSAINEMMQYVDTIPPNKLPRPPGSSP